MLGFCKVVVRVNQISGVAAVYLQVMGVLC